MAKVYKLYTFFAYILPMTALYIWKYDNFSKQGGTFGFFGIIVLMLCVIAFKNFCLEFFKNYRILTVSIIILIIGIISEFLSSELLTIGIFSVIASGISLLFSCVADVYDEHAYKVVDGEKQKNGDPALSQKLAWKEAYGYVFV